MKRLDDIEQWDCAEPFDGAQLRVNRGMYYHHGVYVGGGRVIQFGEGDPRSDFASSTGNKVIESDISDFAKDGLIEVRVYSRAEKKKLRPTDEIISAARSMLGEGGYDFVHNNCEHFSNYCAFGEKTSSQVDNFKSMIRKRIDETAK